MSDEHNNDNGSVEPDYLIGLNSDMISGLQDQFGADMRVWVDSGPMVGNVTPSPEHEGGGTPMSYNRTYRKNGGGYNRYTRSYTRSYSRGYSRHYSRGYNRHYKKHYKRHYNRGKH